MGVSSIYKGMTQLVKNDYISNEEKKEIIEKLLKWGICVDESSGCISYYTAAHQIMECKGLFLMRHAETEAVGSQQFMSDKSQNSKLTHKGIEDVKAHLSDLDDIQFDIVFFGPIKRVIDTKNVVGEILNREFVMLEFLKGIDNQGWENKTYEDLKDNSVFVDREVKHNIFAKTELGTSWGEVLCNCIKVLEYINSFCENLNVLLISQGSILRGIEILLHKRRTPWEDYTATGMYNLRENLSSSNYGKITRII